jgi:hypothetical protein
LRPFIGENRLILAVLAFAFLANQALSSWIGYLSPDSEAYILMSQSLFRQGYPALQGHYNATWPPGYPALIGLFTFTHSYEAVFYASKLVNGLLWLAIGGIVMGRHRGSFMPIFLLITPFSLHIASYTWSENLFIFALVLATNLQLIQAPPAYSRLALAGALIVGFLSRYAFGLLMPALYVCRVLTGGRQPLRQQFPAFAAAIGLFLIYLSANHFLTGFVSGFDRKPATESAFFLLKSFFSANASSILQCLLPLLVALGLSRVRIEWTRNATFLVLVGGGYLALIGILRAHSDFDIYSLRLLGPGWFIVGLGLLEATKNSRPRLSPILAGFLCFLALTGSLARAHYHVIDIYEANALSKPVARRITERLDVFSQVKAVNIFYFQLAKMPETIANLAQLQFEGKNYRKLQPSDSFKEAFTAVAELHSKPGGCSIDFTPFRTLEEFRQFMAGADGRFGPESEERSSAYLGFSKVFAPQAMVDCTHLLGKSPSSLSDFPRL